MDNTEELQGASAQLATEPTAVQEPKQETEQKSVPDQEHNWREVRRSLDEKERRIRELEYRLTAEAQAKAQQEDDIFKGRDDDDILTVSEARKLAKALEAKTAKAPAIDPEDIVRLKVKDYDEVVSEENVKTYLENNPSLVELVKGSKNPYMTAYDLIKGFKKATGSAMPKPLLDDKKLEAIAQKPKSANSVIADAKPFAGANSIQSIEARRAEALKRASQYLHTY